MRGVRPHRAHDFGLFRPAAAVSESQDGSVTTMAGLFTSAQGQYLAVHLFRCHVIEHDNIRTCFHGFFYHVKIFCLYLDLTDKRSICVCSKNSFFYTACRINMIIFEQNTVYQICLIRLSYLVQVLCSHLLL